MPSRIADTTTIRFQQSHKHSDMSDGLRHSITMVKTTNRKVASRRARIGKRTNTRRLRARPRRRHQELAISQERSQQGPPEPASPVETQYQEPNLLLELLVAFENDLAEWRCSRQPRSRTHEDHSLARSPDCSISNDTWARFRQFIALAPIPQRIRDVLQGTVGGMHFHESEIYWYYSRQPRGHVTLISSQRFTSLGPLPDASLDQDIRSSTTTMNEIPARDDSANAPWNWHVTGKPASRNETAFVLNTFLLVLEMCRHRLAWGHSVFEIRVRRGCASFETDATEVTPHLPCPFDIYSLTSLRKLLTQRITYIYNFKQWYAGVTAGGPNMRRPFPWRETFSEPCLEVDVYLFRTGVLDEQYNRNGRRFKFSEDTLCQMYGIGLHELLGLLDMDLDTAKYIATLENYHKLLCYLGPATVQDISKQTSWVSYAIRNVGLARRGNFKAGSVDETLKAQQREFTITELLVEAVTGTTVFVNNGLEAYFHRNLPQQPRSRDSSVKEQDWEKLTHADQKRLLGNKQHLFHLYISNATAERHAHFPRNTPVIMAAVEPRRMARRQRQHQQALGLQSNAVQMPGSTQEALDPRTVTGFPPGYVPQEVASLPSLDSNSTSLSSSPDTVTPMDFAQRAGTSVLPSEPLLPNASTHLVTQGDLYSEAVHTNPGTGFHHGSNDNYINHHRNYYSHSYSNNHAESQRDDGPTRQSIFNPYGHLHPVIVELWNLYSYCYVVHSLLVQESDRYHNDLYGDQSYSQTVVDPSNPNDVNNRSLLTSTFVSPPISWDQALSAGFMYRETDYNRENMLASMVPSEYVALDGEDDHDPYMPVCLRGEGQ